MKNRVAKVLLSWVCVSGVCSLAFGDIGTVFESNGIVELKVAAARCRIDLVGGRVLSYAVDNGPDVVWFDQTSGGANAEWIHGGVPICWPFFGRRADGVHGDSWRRRMEILSRTQEEGRCAVSLGLATAEGHLVYTLDLMVRSLRLSVSTRNVSDRPLNFACALHPYFRIGDRDRTVVRGVSGKELPLNAAINSDFTDFDADCEIVDPVLRRTIALRFGGASSVGVWNPGAEMRCAGMLPDGAWKNFVCVEPRLGVAFPEMLAPGAEKAISCEVSCVPFEESALIHKWRPSERWRGVNLPYCLYDKGVRKDAFYREEDFYLVKELGMNFVRLPLDYRCWIVEGDWRRIDDASLAPLDKAIEWAEKYGLHVQFSLHRAPGFSVNRVPQETMNIFSDPEARAVCELHWRHIARRYAKVPNERLSFNPLNETPAHPALSEVLNRLVTVIHEEDPDRFVVCDGSDVARTPVQGLATGPLVGQAIRGYLPMTISHCGVSYLSEALARAKPHWPMYGFTSPLYGPAKGKLSVPLRIENAPAGAWQVVFGRVNGRSELVASSAGKVVAGLVLNPMTNDVGYAKAVYSPRWGVTSGRPVNPWTFTLPEPVEELQIAVREGDWAEVDEIVVTDSFGRRAELPGVFEWNVLANLEPLLFRGFDSQVPFAERGAPLTGEGWLEENVMRPWIPLIEKGEFVMVGECGATRNVPYPLYLSWMEDQLRLWKRYNLGYAFWTLRGAFGPLDTRRKGTYETDFHGHKLDQGLYDLIMKYR